MYKTCTDVLGYATWPLLSNPAGPQQGCVYVGFTTVTDAPSFLP